MKFWEIIPEKTTRVSGAIMYEGHIRIPFLVVKNKKKEGWNVKPEPSRYWRDYDKSYRSGERIFIPKWRMKLMCVKMKKAIEKYRDEHNESPQLALFQ